MPLIKGSVNCKLMGLFLPLSPESYKFENAVELNYIFADLKFSSRWNPISMNAQTPQIPLRNCTFLFCFK